MLGRFFGLLNYRLFTLLSGFGGATNQSGAIATAAGGGFVLGFAVAAASRIGPAEGA